MENDQEDFYARMNNELGCPSNILPIHHKFNDPFVPVSQKVQVLPIITSLFDPSKMKLSYETLLTAAKIVKHSYRLADKDCETLEEAIYKAASKMQILESA